MGVWDIWRLVRINGDRWDDRRGCCWEGLLGIIMLCSWGGIWMLKMYLSYVKGFFKV